MTLGHEVTNRAFRITTSGGELVGSPVPETWREVEKRLHKYVFDQVGQSTVEP